MKSKFVQYYVEGEDEKKLIEVLKAMEMIRPGKVQTLNVIEREIANARLMSIQPGTMVVLVFDTDTGYTHILAKNLKKLEKCVAVSETVTIPQVPDLEQELVRSCDIKRVTELLGSRSRKDFKGDLIRVTNLAAKLREHHFNIQEFWNKKPTGPYRDIPIENQAGRVKLV